ncbi:MAG: hypothetical protein AAGE89_11285 [Pseudomonadota bacterium]
MSSRAPTKLYVRATKRGYFDGLRSEGDCFFIETKEQFSDKWMEEAARPKEVPVPVTINAADLAAKEAQIATLKKQLSEVKRAAKPAAK